MGLFRSLLNKKKAAPKPVAAWVVPMPGPGGGGIRTILQNARAMEQAGYDCRLYVCPAPGLFVDTVAVERDLLDWYGITFPVRFEARLPEDVTCAIATAWNTAPFVAVQDVASKLYFVQDYEPDFLTMGDDRVEATRTYRSGLSIVTIGRWLAGTMEEASGRPVPYTDFCADLAVYRPDPEVERERAVCAIYQPEKPRRLPRLVEEALAVVHRLDPTIAVYTYGNPQGPRVEGVEHLGLLSTDGCADLYRRCSVGLSVSATNPSRIPFEMMACGLPVIDTAGDNGSLDFPAGGVSRARPDPAALAVAIVELVNDPARRAAMGEAGTAYMADRPLSREGRMFTEAVEGLIGQGEQKPATTGSPLEDRARTIEKERTLEAYGAMVASGAPLKGHRIELFVPLEAMGADTVMRAACWSGKEQEDLQWVEGTFDPEKGATAVLEIPERDDVTVWNIHPYAFPSVGDPRLLGTLDPAIDSRGATEPGAPHGYGLAEDLGEALLAPMN